MIIVKKTVSFTLAVIGTIAALVALILYLKSGPVMNYVVTMNVIAIVAGVLYLVTYGKLGAQAWHPYLLSVAAVLVLGAVGYSLIVEVEALGYLVSGLRQWSDVAVWAYFAIVGVVSWLVLLVASFCRTPAKQ